MSEQLEKTRKSEVRSVLSFLLVLTIICLTALGMVLLFLNKREATQEDKHAVIPAVEVQIVRKSNYQITLPTQGVIQSARETMLAAEVGGRVMEISNNLRRGGTVQRGELLVRIDPVDYQSQLANAQVNEADAQLALAQEEARVEQAELDWKRLGRGNSANPLVLRKPQLAAAKARLRSTRESVSRARREIERTEILAPFQAGVRSAPVEIGSVVTAGTVVAELYAGNDLEVRLPLGLEDFGFLQRDENGLATGDVTLTAKIGLRELNWKAEIARVDPEIERTTLSANVVARVLPGDRPDFPLPPVGLFVNAIINGQTMENVVEIPRRALLEGDQVITVNEDNEISLQTVEVVRLNDETAVLHGGLNHGEKIVLTRLPTPVNGMRVATETINEAKE